MENIKQYKKIQLTIGICRTMPLVMHFLEQRFDRLKLYFQISQL